MFRSNAIEVAIVVAGALMAGFNAGRYEMQKRLAPFLRSTASGDELREDDIPSGVRV